jgi:hypothetical protein
MSNICMQKLLGTLQNCGHQQPLSDMRVAAVMVPCDTSRRTKVRWVLGYLYSYNSSFTSFIYKDRQRLDGFYVICTITVADDCCTGSHLVPMILQSIRNYHVDLHVQTECFWHAVKHLVVCEYIVCQLYMLVGHI